MNLKRSSGVVFEVHVSERNRWTRCDIARSMYTLSKNYFSVSITTDSMCDWPRLGALSWLGAIHTLNYRRIEFVLVHDFNNVFFTYCVTRQFTGLLIETPLFHRPTRVLPYLYAACTTTTKLAKKTPTMSLSNKYDIGKPAHFRSLRKNQSRRSTLEAQEPPHPPTYDDYDTRALLRDDTSGSHSQRLSPDYCPSSQPSPKYGASTRSNTPRESQAMRQTNSSRGGKRKPRAVPELEIVARSRRPQNRYQQAVSYVGDAVQKTADTLAILPNVFGAVQHLPIHLQESRGLYQSMAPSSPILRELQSNQEGSYFSIKAGLRVTDHRKDRLDRQTAYVTQTTQSDKQHPQDKERSTSFSEQPAEQSSRGKEDISKSSSKQDLVEAIQGLIPFGHLQLPVSEPFRMRALDRTNNRADDTDYPSCVRIADGPTQATPSASVSGDVASQPIPNPVSKGVSITAASDEKVKDVEAITVNVGHGHEPSISNTLSDSPIEQNAPQAVDKLSVQSVHPSNPEKTNAQPFGKEYNTSEEYTSNVTPRIEQELGTDSNEDSFEDITLGGQTPDSSSPSVQSSSLDDDDFQVVDTSNYQTQRNGRPGIWERWV
jgi:hypothetical protein